MKLTIDLLKKLSACEEGIKFVQEYGLEGYPLNKLNEIEGDYCKFVKFLKNTEIIKYTNDELIFLCLDVFPDLQIIKKFDENGNLTFYSIGGRLINEYYYDENNKLVYKGNEHIIRNFYYDEKGNLIYELVEENILNKLNIYSNETEYDENGNKILEKSGKYEHTFTKYYYNDDNKLIFKEDIFDVKNTLFTNDYTNYYYDEKGRLLFKENNKGYQVENKYDEKGNIIYHREGDGFYQRTYNEQNVTTSLIKTIRSRSTHTIKELHYEFITNKEFIIIKENNKIIMEIPLKCIK